MGTKFVIVTIKGTSALLMHAYPMADPPKAGKVGARGTSKNL